MNVTKKNNNWKVFLIILACIITFVTLCIFDVYNAQNRAISLEENVNSSLSDIKVQEKRRIDLLGNLVDCVKEYDKHEYNTLKDVVKERSSNTTDSDVNDIKTQINAVAEQYPDLKSNKNYKTLMNEFSMTENLIAEHRTAYNNTVKNYNRYCRKFPTKIFLSLTGYEFVNYEYLNYDTSEDAPQDLFD